ncbi:MAG: UDP-N-acetylmuramate--L-alanine ligase [Epsilonproteobacteria bacterium]|nr:UDP-N-acetylmuramate--L-alanine ligase [Campylobacterota bacterium]|tara:strand:+ start:2864 stop:4258 length:1395 start_codon:yes stop_codon:yes gene_type:complete
MHNSSKHIHFIGISGIGMSGIAKILLQQGYTISGCDQNINEKHVQELRKLGCTIATTHLHNICLNSSINSVVYSSNVSTDHPELQYARQNNIPILLRADMLALLMKEKESIGIAGSHGKTSTSAIVAHILSYCKLDPSVIIGGHINTINSNAHNGKGKYLVAETDESDRSLLRLPKTYNIVTNVDLEHLETYTNFQDIQNTFIEFINTTMSSGISVLCIDDTGIQSIIPNITTPFITYGQSSHADIQIHNILLHANSSTFTIYHKATNTILGSITFPQAGLHYALNATGAIALALHLNLPFTQIQESLLSFTGVDRRFSYKGKSKQHNSDIYDDYGHHPLEINYALQVARKKAKNKLIVVFQPHRFSRTYHLWDNFVQVLSQNIPDLLIITDIYTANEKPIANISSQNLTAFIKKINPNTKIIYRPADNNFDSIISTLNDTLHTDDLLLLLGAGKVNKIADKLI